jgi:hypothetical protein
MNRYYVEFVWDGMEGEPPQISFLTSADQVRDQLGNGIDQIKEF